MIQRSYITIHTEERLGHDPALSPRRALSEPAEEVLQMVTVIVSEPSEISPAQQCSLYQTMVHKTISQNQILSIGQGGKYGDIGLIACSEEQTPFNTVERSNPLLQLVVKLQRARHQDRKSVV